MQFKYNKEIENKNSFLFGTFVLNTNRALIEFRGWNEIETDETIPKNGSFHIIRFEPIQILQISSSYFLVAEKDCSRHK